MDGWLDECMDEWMDGWMSAWISGWMDEWMNEWMVGLGDIKNYVLRLLQYYNYSLTLSMIK